ncbi:MAG TPA: hypothetical protein VFU14_04090 [Acidimicrobiales bacterium]|nr:hypothetical protein [Acidimicrobiales bacterium]
MIGSLVEAVRREGLWPGGMLLAGGAAGALAAHVAATWGDPAAGASLLVTAAVVLGSLMAIGIGSELVVTAEGSPMRHVFTSDSLGRTTRALLVLAALLVVSVVVLGCFDDLHAHSRVTARALAGAGMLGAAMALGVFAGVARWLAARAREQEQDQL